MPDPVLLTPTQFAWRAIGAPPWPPPEPRRRGLPRYGPDPVCWLCGGPTDGVGWPRELATADTFTDHNKGAVRASRTTCQACVYTSQAAAWSDYVQRHGLPYRCSKVIAWRYFSHLFTLRGHQVIERRSDARALLLDPPEPPFLLVLSLSRQKHLLFRARVATSRDRFPVQFEEQTLLLGRERFSACLAAVERALALGFGREEVETGAYHQARLLAAGLAAWRQVEQELRPWRLNDPDLVRLCCWLGSRPSGATEADQEEEAEAREESVVATAPRGQLALMFGIRDSEFGIREARGPNSEPRVPSREERR